MNKGITVEGDAILRFGYEGNSPILAGQEFHVITDEAQRDLMSGELRFLRWNGASVEERSDLEKTAIVEGEIDETSTIDSLEPETEAMRTIINSRFADMGQPEITALEVRDELAAQRKVAASRRARIKR